MIFTIWNVLVSVDFSDIQNTSVQTMSRSNMWLPFIGSLFGAFLYQLVSGATFAGMLPSYVACLLGSWIGVRFLSSRLARRRQKEADVAKDESR